MEEDLSGALTDEINIIYPHMEYEVVVYEQRTVNWKFLGMKMCRREEIMKCNHVKRQLSSRSQEDVTGISLGGYVDSDRGPIKKKTLYKKYHEGIFQFE